VRFVDQRHSLFQQYLEELTNQITLLSSRHNKVIKQMTDFEEVLARLADTSVQLTTQVCSTVHVIRWLHRTLRH
jgi:hypothetical protein